MTFTARASARPAAERVASLLTRAKLPLGRGPSGSLLCWCKEVTKKHLESRASPGGPARGFCDGMKAPYTTRPSQADTSFASQASLWSQAKRKAIQPGTTELSLECSSLHGFLVQVLRGMLCSDALSLGYFSLHEQRSARIRKSQGRLLWLFGDSLPMGQLAGIEAGDFEHQRLDAAAGDRRGDRHGPGLDQTRAKSTVVVDEQRRFAGRRHDRLHALGGRVVERDGERGAALGAVEAGVVEQQIHAAAPLRMLA